MTLQEKKDEAKRFKLAEEFSHALTLYREIYGEEKNEWNGYFLAYCLRKMEDFAEAGIIQQEVHRDYPYFKPIINEILWLEYSTKIKDWTNNNFLADAQSIIARSDQYDKWSDKVFIKTILAVARRVSGDPFLKRSWLDKLDQAVLDNKVFRFNNITYPADRKVFFIEYADALIEARQHTDFIEEKLANLNFSGVKHTEFLKYIVADYSFPNSDGSIWISRTKLALHIKNFQEEIHLRKKVPLPTIYLEHKRASVSDLSHYLFCPVSFAINETYEIYANSSWERDEWVHDKLYLSDRYKMYKETGSITEAFKDTMLRVNAETNTALKEIFNAELLVHNTPGNPAIYEGMDGNLLGAPDYVFKHTNGEVFILTEKFSHLSAREHDQPFDSDLIKPLAFLEHFPQLELKYGLIINWFWTLEDVDPFAPKPKKKITIKACRIHRVEKGQNPEKLERTIRAVSEFKKQKKLSVNGERIAYPPKCLNCSVVSYCHHKTGRFNEVTLPYQLMNLSSNTDNRIGT